MHNTIRPKIVSAIVLTTLFIPKIALAIDLYKQTLWANSSLYSKPYKGIASGIGGLEVNFENNLQLQPSDLSYNDGNLIINNFKNRQTPIYIPISKGELNDVLYLVQKDNSESVLQTSIDITAVESSVNYSPALEETIYVNELFHLADKEFASMINGGLTSAKLRGVAPSTEALKLLDIDNDYRQLPQQWIKQPFSYPQIFIFFDPDKTELIGMRFRPQVLFSSPSGHIVEVDRQTEEIGERPYLQLKEDFAQNPNVYLETLPIVRRTASITSALGFVSAACKPPRDCQHLEIESNSDEKAQLEEEYERLRNRIDIIGVLSVLNLSGEQLKLHYKWSELSLSNFQPNNSPEAWGHAYDAVRQIIDHTKEFGIKQAALNSESLESEEQDLLRLLANLDLELARKQFVLSKEQFLNYSIPEDDALLNAAEAVIFISEGGEINVKKAKQSLNKGIKLAEQYPGTQIEVAYIGLFIGAMIRDQWDKEEGKSLMKEMNKMTNEAQLKLYDMVDNYLSECMTNLDENCYSIKLQTLEVDLARAGLDNSLETRDVSWLWGRLSYLIAVQEPKWKVDRKRLLLSYARSAEEYDHRRELMKLADRL